MPGHHIREKKILPSKIYHRIINKLGEINFSGVLLYHRYNEPLMDPRLSAFISYARHKLYYSYLRAYTNGYYLTQEIVDDLSESGMN
jgi:MoaA/NifB/PqqE/SkfB family radical SAM enzyme